MSELGLCKRAECGNPALWLYRGYDRDRPEEPVCDPCYQAEEFAPGHVRTGDETHFMGICHDCDARRLVNATMEQVENWYWRGMIGQDVFEAYCHAWWTSAPRFSEGGSWMLSPTIPEVVRLVAIMRGTFALRVTAAR